MPSGPGGLRSRLRLPRRGDSARVQARVRGRASDDTSSGVTASGATGDTSAPSTGGGVPQAVRASKTGAGANAQGRGRNAPIRSWMITKFSLLHGWLYDRSDGRLGGRLVGKDMCLLWHTGRKSGQIYRTALLCVPDGDDIMVVGSFFGNAKHPQWYRNLQSSPTCTVRYRRWKGEATARTCEGDERAARWAVLTERWPAFEGYAAETDRELPVVVLSPVSK